MIQTNDVRLDKAEKWLQQVLNEDFEIRPLAGDASFRRYFRIYTTANAHGKTWVLMDAPPDKEDSRPFLNVRTWLQSASLRVPDFIAMDAQQGFLLLEDFGDATWAVYLKEKRDTAPLFSDALRQLHSLQAALPTFELPIFDVARMQRECNLYLDWYLPKVASYRPTEAECQLFHDALLPSLRCLQKLPQVAVHLDYHSRNLMVPKGGLPLGIIDFQDAVIGPVTYDLASLLYDCYQDYPETLRREWSYSFFSGLPVHLKRYFTDFDDWHHVLRLTAFQRHIKTIGIFARLAHRDGKTNFLNEIPLTRKHLRDEMNMLNLPSGIYKLLQR